MIVVLAIRWLGKVQLWTEKFLDDASEDDFESISHHRMILRALVDKDCHARFLPSLALLKVCEGRGCGEAARARGEFRAAEGAAWHLPQCKGVQCAASVRPADSPRLSDRNTRPPTYSPTHTPCQPYTPVPPPTLLFLSITSAMPSGSPTSKS